MRLARWFAVALVALALGTPVRAAEPRLSANELHLTDGLRLSIDDMAQLLKNDLAARLRMNLMLAGDHAVPGDNYIFEGVAAKREKPATPFAYVATIPILAYVDGVAINKNAPHPYAAALYADWAVSPESQAYVVHILRGSVTQKHATSPTT